MLTHDARRDIVLDFLDAWDKHPQLRFCQIVQLIAGQDDPFYMEDRQFRQCIRRLLAKEV